MSPVSIHPSLLRRCAMITIIAATLLSLSSRISIAESVWAEDAELVMHNGVIHTMNEDQPLAQAIAIKGDRIVAVGDNESIQEWVGEETSVIDLRGRTVVPGFIESHGHFLGIGSLLMELNLTEVTSWNEIVRLVGEAAAEAEPGEWIIGRGWHQSLWDEKPVPNFGGYPSHQALSAVSPDNPVLLVHRSGHMSMANAMAMEEAGVSAGTEDPDGGEILRNDDREPIGVFRETAQSLISRALARSRENIEVGDRRLEFERQVELAQHECLSHGITTFVDAGSGPSTIRTMAELIELGRVDIRMWYMLRGGNRSLLQSMDEMTRYKGYANHHLTVGGIKQMVDGALGAHGAWLIEPYSDKADYVGLAVTPMETIREAAEIAYEHKLQLCVHAIGDRANRECLDLFEEFVEKGEGDSDLRWRIEHAQHLHPDDIPRFAELGVIASMQANHCTSDGPFVPDRLGPVRSSQGAYVWQSLLESGAKIANGTDAPVEPIDPIACFYSSVSRKMRDGVAFYPEQAMTREQALRSYTIDAAYAIFEEDLKGSIEVGKLADLVVLSQDIMSVDESELLDTTIQMTLIGGQVVYQRETE